MKEVYELWPELEWIKDTGLREKTARTWELALSKSVLSAEDLDQIPFTLLVEDLDVTFMAHKRCVVHLARDWGNQIQSHFGKEPPVNMEMF
jgi:hypothetical protein